MSFGVLKKPYSKMISEMGKLLDLIANKYEVIFVVAAGNDREKHHLESLNSPADSLNSIAVGSSEYDKNEYNFSNYSSFGSVLHYEKPEVSYFGGPYNKDGSTFFGYYNNNRTSLTGTSFVSPRVSRMIAHFLQKGMNITEAKAKIISLAKYVPPLRKASSFRVIDFEVDPQIELFFTANFKNNKPRLLPLELIDGVEKIIFAYSWIVKPHSKLGEEYSIHNLEMRLIIYDKTYDQPLRDKMSKTIKCIDKRKNKKYGNESFQRFMNGKYFNSNLKEYKYEDIQKEINTFCKEKRC